MKKNLLSLAAILLFALPAFSDHNHNNQINNGRWFDFDRAHNAVHKFMREFDHFKIKAVDQSIGSEHLKDDLQDMYEFLEHFSETVESIANNYDEEEMEHFLDDYHELLDEWEHIYEVVRSDEDALSDRTVMYSWWRANTAFMRLKFELPIPEGHEEEGEEEDFDDHFEDTNYDFFNSKSQLRSLHYKLERLTGQMKHFRRGNSRRDEHEHDRNGSHQEITEELKAFDEAYHHFKETLNERPIEYEHATGDFAEFLEQYEYIWEVFRECEDDHNHRTMRTWWKFVEAFEKLKWEMPQVHHDH